MQVFHKNTNSYTMSARVPFLIRGSFFSFRLWNKRQNFNFLTLIKVNEKENAKSNLSIAL